MGGKKPKEGNEERTKKITSAYHLSTPKVQTEIDDFGALLSKKDLGDVEAELLNAGWLKDVDKGVTIFTLKVPIGNGYDKKYILHHNSIGKAHSINGKPVKYWKLYEDKKTSKKVLFRASNDANFSAGGYGKTFINGSNKDIK